jgi:ABC-2 type transport system permease protein
MPVFWLVLRYEILKTFRKWRTYIGFIAVAILVPLVEIALRAQGDSLVKSMSRGLATDFIIVGNLLNMYFVTYFIMNSLWVHIPFLIALGAGDQLAGEATGGTFRLILIRPVSRTGILAAKYLTTLLYTALLVGFLGLLSLGLGAILLGTGDLIIPGRALVILPKAEALWRICVAFLFAIWGMWCVASLAFLFSSLVENAIGPIVGTMAVIIVFYIVTSVPVDLFVAIRPYLFTTYFNLWQKIMEQPIPWPEIVQSLAVLGGFSVGFYLLTWYIFARKDILS